MKAAATVGPPSSQTRWISRPAKWASTSRGLRVRRCTVSALSSGVQLGLFSDLVGMRLRNVPPMRVLNRSFATLPPASLLVYAGALLASLALTVQVTGDLKLALWVLGGLAALALLAAGGGFALLMLVRGLQHRLHGNWRLGLMARDITTTYNAWSINADELRPTPGAPVDEIPTNRTEITLPTFVLAVAG